MKRILFISSEYYPSPSPNGQCVEKVMRKCRDRGYLVEYLGATYYDKYPKVEIINDITVHRVKRAFYNRIIHHWRSMPLIFGFPLMALSTLLLIFNKFILISLWPLEDLILVCRIFREAVLLHKINNYDLIVVTCNPLAAMVAVHKLKKMYHNLPCIFYYLDALSVGNGVKVNEKRFRYFPFKKYFFHSAKRWEDMFVESATTIVVTEATRSYYECRYAGNDIGKKIEFLGIPTLEERRLVQNSDQCVDESIFTPGKKHILFVGSMGKLRDPAYILEVIKNLECKDGEFVFVGTFASKHKKMINRVRASHPDLIRICNAMPRPDLEVYMRNADFFLNVEDNVPTLYASKIFEYISYGKPVISNAYSIDEPTVKVLEEYSNSLVLFNFDDARESAKLLDKFLVDNYGVSIEYSKCKEKFYKSTPDAFVDIIDKHF